MNPRHRRLLIPGLLLALLVVVVISSLAGRSDAATSSPTPAGSLVSTLDDQRINESSGLVVSSTDDDLAYTVNDSGGAPVVYAIRISSGRTVGTTTLDADLADTEALSSDGRGTLWIADIGDNDSKRTDVALYALPEPGTRTASVRPRRYPVTYPGGPLDAEALAIQPGSGEKFIISKGLFGGTVFRLPDRLRQDAANEAVALPGDIPGLVTDAAFTPDGLFVVARDYSEAFVLDPQLWQIVDKLALPKVDQGETLAMEATGRSILVGSEGTRSPLYRVPFTEPAVSRVTVPPATDGPATPTPAATGRTSSDAGGGFAGATWFWAVLVVGLLMAISAGAVRKT